MVSLCFRDCGSLAAITFESGSQLSELAKQAFAFSGVRSIHLAGSVTIIGESCFSDCRLLASITFESGSQLSELAKEAFCWSGLTSIHLPASVTFMGKRCFSECGSLASITFDPASKFRAREADLLVGVPLGVTEARQAEELYDDDYFG
jgi:hypothetical protein